MKINAYDFGSIDINGKSYLSDVIITPDEVKHSWWRKEGHRLQICDLDDVVDAEPELVIIGTGYHGNMKVPEQTRTYLEKKGIKVLSYRTTQAVAEFNKLQQHYARIVAALHLTC